MAPKPGVSADWGGWLLVGIALLAGAEVGGDVPWVVGIACCVVYPAGPVVIPDNGADVC